MSNKVLFGDTTLNICKQNGKNEIGENTNATTKCYVWKNILND
jgi:hypothetical protein